MHPYAVDLKERNSVIIKLTVISMILALLIGEGISWLSTIVPFITDSLWWKLIDFPALFGVFFGLFNWFNRSLWKNKWVRRILGVKTPILDGRWQGTLRSSYDDFNTPYPVELYIHQNWYDICIELKTNSSKSFSISASLLVENRPGQIRLHYEYQNEPNANAPDTMNIHKGTTQLILDLETQTLEGEYYTSQDRRQWGTITLQRAS
ncbi:hypothetical protein ACNR9V_01025 [Parageobacillus thermoglucosidasius]|uniref:Cap15 family cyclic dinucleotide receptor domain-containing protein n=1 Tax=Parageobacillus thermoglucosidasius TaxID=1426 RepID=UPI003B68336A